jgi:hypothetical protein
MAIGWLILYSKYRKARNKNQQYEYEHEYADEICSHCGYRFIQHSDDGYQSCPVYLEDRKI